VSENQTARASVAVARSVASVRTALLGFVMLQLRRHGLLVVVLGGRALAFAISRCASAHASTTLPGVAFSGVPAPRTHTRDAEREQPERQQRPAIQRGYGRRWQHDKSCRYSAVRRQRGRCVRIRLRRGAATTRREAVESVTRCRRCLTDAGSVGPGQRRAANSACSDWTGDTGCRR